MSFTFDILGDRPVTYQALCEAADLPELLCAEKVDHVAPLTGIYHLYLNGLSCRSAELAKGSRGYTVRVNSPSSPDDHGLALLLVEQLAKLSGAANIKGEGDSAMDAQRFRENYSGAWIRQQVSSGVQSILLIARGIEAGEACEVPGAVRRFYVGPRLASEVLALGSPQSIEDEFFRRFSAVQYVERQGYYYPNIYILTANKGKVCGLAPDVAFLIPWVKYVALVAADDGSPVFVSYEDFPKIAGGRLSWLDEKQALMEAIPKTEWPAFCALASEFGVSPRDVQA